MSQVGRNDPCPCGSGKKYKKCCIDKPLEEVQEDFKEYSDNLWSYDDVNEMTTEEIIGTLQSMGIPFDNEAFLRDVERFYSAQELSESWFETFKVTAVDLDEDFPWLAAWVLWERLVPAHKMSMEQMDDLIMEAYEDSDELGSKATCDTWLGVWEAIKYRIKPEFKTVEYLDKHYKGSFDIVEFCQGLDLELENAGLMDSLYFEKRIEFCKEFCSFFPDEDELIIHDMRSAIADSYVVLEKFGVAQNALDSLVRDYPYNPWSYIKYGDMYTYDNDLIKDYKKAKEFYDKALVLAKDKQAKEAIAERLKKFRR